MARPKRERRLAFYPNQNTVWTTRDGMIHVSLIDEDETDRTTVLDLGPKTAMSLIGRLTRAVQATR